jgi:hypothetical protein
MARRSIEPRLRIASAGRDGRIGYHDSRSHVHSSNMVGVRLLLYRLWLRCGAMHAAAEQGDGAESGEADGS